MTSLLRVLQDRLCKQLPTAESVNTSEILREDFHGRVIHSNPPFINLLGIFSANLTHHPRVKVRADLSKILVTVICKLKGSIYDHIEVCRRCPFKICHFIEQDSGASTALHLVWHRAHQIGGSMI